MFMNKVVSGLNFYTTKYAYDTLRNKKYFVRVPTIATYSPEEIKLFGLPVTITNEGDMKTLLSDMSDVYLDLLTIVDIYSRGFPLFVKREEDAVNIALTINDVLDKFERAVNGRNDDLVSTLNDFLAEVVGIHNTTISKKITKNEDELKEDLGMDIFENDASVKPKRYSNLNNIKIDLN